MEKRFATQLTHLFTQPYSPESKLDLVCRLACKAVEASSTSILMYDGREDKLHCKGRYIDPEVGGISIKNNPTLLHITRNICAYQYLYCSREKIGIEKPEVLYKEYVEDVYPGKKAISKENFINLIKRINEWKNEYESLQRVFQNERYNVDLKTEWITGKWYRQLSESRKDYSPDILTKNLDEVDVEKKHFCMKSLEEQLDLQFSAKYYAALPLFAGGRYFGVLRFLFPGEKKTLFKQLDKDKEWTLLEPHKEKFLDIAQKISLHLEIDYFLNGYKKTTLTSQKYAHQKEPLDKFLNSQCESLSEIIRSRGALIRRWDEDKEIFEIVGYSKNLKKYIESSQDKDQTFFKALSEKFGREKLLGVYFNCIEYPFEVTKFIYFEEKGRLKYERAKWEITELKESDILLTLIELELVNIAIFPIPGAGQYFIVFFNSENRAFLNKDIEMIYPALRNFGLALQARKYTQKIENRLNTINQMHREISKTLAEKDCITHEYVIEFLNIIFNTVKRLEIFPYHILWEYVSEILPKGKLKKEQYMLRNITRQIFEDNPIKAKRNDYKELKLNSDEFSEKVLNYFKKGRLTPLFEFPSMEDFSYFDLPFFAENDSGVPSLKLVGMITLIYRREDENLVTTDEFFNFMEFFSSQLSLAWNQFQERIVAKIQEKIDYQIRFGKKEKVRTKKEELTLISKVLADEFNGDLCCFFLANEQEKTLKLETGSIPIERNIIYSLVDEKPPLSVISYQTNKNIRIFGRKRLEELVDLEKLTLIEEAVKDKILENYKKDEDYRGILVEHWLSVVISIGEKKLGLMRLFRIKGTDNPDDKKRFDYVTPPFSEFETNLLTRIQKHIFNIIFARQTIQQRMEDMRNVLHQVIAPLHALMEQSRNIAEGIVPKSKIPDKLSYMNVLAKLAVKYARNFQKILDLDTGNIKLYKELLPDLRQYLIGLSIDYQALIKSKCIHIHVTPETQDNLSLEVDKVLFDNAISNLIDNAAKYSFYPEERLKISLQGKPKSPRDKENVLITAQETSNAVVITISNWGIALSEEERKNVFKREFRGAKAIDRAPIGTGIGLFLAKEIIKLHNGQIELVPGTHENNIVFKITLPKKGKGGNNE